MHPSTGCARAWCSVSLIVAMVTAQYSKQFAGPYLIDIKEIAKCGGGDGRIKQLYDSTRLSKINRTTYVFSANMYFTEGFDNNMQAEFSFAVFGNGGWKSNYHQLNLEKVCDDAKALFPTTSASFFRAIGQNDCPFPAGNYTLKNFPVQLKVNIPVLPYNKYRVDGFLKRKGKRYTCVRIFVDVIPKKKPFHSN